MHASLTLLVIYIDNLDLQNLQCKLVSKLLIISEKNKSQHFFIRKGFNEVCCYSIQWRNEFTICRIYIKSGSSRAFDRRPTEAYGIERKLPSNGVETSSRAAISTSPETSHLRENKVDSSVNATTITQSISEMVDGLSQPFWEWEQMNQS